MNVSNQFYFPQDHTLSLSLLSYHSNVIRSIKIIPRRKVFSLMLLVVPFLLCLLWFLKSKESFWPCQCHKVLRRKKRRSQEEKNIQKERNFWKEGWMSTQGFNVYRMLWWTVSQCSNRARARQGGGGTGRHWHKWYCKQEFGLHRPKKHSSMLHFHVQPPTHARTTYTLESAGCPSSLSDPTFPSCDKGSENQLSKGFAHYLTPDHFVKVAQFSYLVFLRTVLGPMISICDNATAFKHK